MSAWSEELETLYKTQDLCGQHGANSEVPELIAQNFTTLQGTLLPKLHKVFNENQDANPQFLSPQRTISNQPVHTETWGDMHTAIGNLILAMHLALPFVEEPLFMETIDTDLYPEYEMITVSVGNELLRTIQSPDADSTSAVT